MRVKKWFFRIFSLPQPPALVLWMILGVLITLAISSFYKDFVSWRRNTDYDSYVESIKKKHPFFRRSLSGKPIRIGSFKKKFDHDLDPKTPTIDLDAQYEFMFYKADQGAIACGIISTDKRSPFFFGVYGFEVPHKAGDWGYGDIDMGDMGTWHVISSSRDYLVYAHTPKD